MLISEGQAQHWMPTANWNDPKKFSELQPEDREPPTALLYDQAQGITKWLHLETPRAFQNPVD